MAVGENASRKGSGKEFLLRVQKKKNFVHFSCHFVGAAADGELRLRRLDPVETIFCISKALLMRFYATEGAPFLKMRRRAEKERRPAAGKGCDSFAGVRTTAPDLVAIRRILCRN